MSSSRMVNSIRNTSYAFIAQIINSLIMFITRTVFIYELGNTYLGLNGLFSDILALLSLAELGFGTAITYSMYQPVAEKNEREISALLDLYGRVYRIIGVFITIIGLLLIPHLSFFISNMPELPELPIIYTLYLLNTSSSYFFAHKKCILVATQKSYITSKIQLLMAILQNFFQIIFLFLVNNFLVYLVIQVFFTLLNNIYISLYVDKNYSYLKKYKKEVLDQKVIKKISKNVLAMSMSKISSAVVTSTDNILISKFVGTITLGYFSNYTLFTNLIRTIMTKIFESIAGSVGNLLAVETKEKSYEVFKKIWFVNFWLVAVSCIGLYNLINPFIALWAGKSYVLSNGVVFWICLNLYIRLMRNTALVYSDSYGLFWNFRWKSIAESIINLVASLIYIRILNLGIAGVLIGTFTSNLLTNFWYEPYVIYKNIFKKKSLEYYVIFFKYLIVTISTGLLLSILCQITKFVNPLSDFVIDLFLCSLLPNLIFVIVFYKSTEFDYFSKLIITILRKFRPVE